MTARGAWSSDRQDALIFSDLNTDTVEIQYHHFDESDADEDYSVTVGEFSIAALQRALAPPLPLTQHVVNKRPSPFARLFRGKKGWQ